ncbi:uncharacterized protein LOC128730822 [Anopheles nili]|uniref:uncharacterized protein LOC128730822 n=1 Tax=Anopheles nili TaxID=185578 RepID=UPI00237BCFE6|nr:uncharacterized protein LOC128730822 [Anopheles nili]
MSDTEEDSTCSDSWPINEDWLMEVLKKHHEVRTGIKITDFKVKQGCQDGVNNLSDILSVSVVYEFERNAGQSINQSLDIVIKLLPQDPFSRYFVTEAKFDLREIKFYTSILPDLMSFQEQYIPKELGSMVIAVPTCFYTQYAPIGSNAQMSLGSPDSTESILVLEDMRSLGYKSANFTTGLTLGQTEAAIRAIATIHALSLGLKIKKKADLNEKYPFLFQTKRATESYQQLVEQGMPQLTKFLEQKPGYENELKALSKIRPRTKILIETLLQPIEPMGLITHTDFWCNNLLFRSESDDERTDSCTILDWQMVTYSRPTNDLALLLISSIPSSTRRQHTSRLLDLYYEALKSCCLKMDVDIEAALGYSRNKMDCEYKQSLLLALLLCIGSVDIAIGNPAAEQRLLDVLRDLYDEGILGMENCFYGEYHDTTL